MARKQGRLFGRREGIIKRRARDTGKTAREGKKKDKNVRTYV